MKLLKRLQVNPQNKQFKKLQDFWYKKLEVMGFDDIEQSEDKLKQWSAKNMQRIEQVNLDARTEYYRQAGQFLYSHKFSDPIDKAIWKYHTEGTNYRAIAVLVSKNGVQMGKNRVMAVIHRLRSIMFSSMQGDEVTNHE